MADFASKPRKVGSKSHEAEHKSTEKPLAALRKLMRDFHAGLALLHNLKPVVGKDTHTERVIERPGQVERIVDRDTKQVQRDTHKVERGIDTRVIRENARIDNHSHSEVVRERVAVRKNSPIQRHTQTVSQVVRAPMVERSGVTVRNLSEQETPELRRIETELISRRRESGGTGVEPVSRLSGSDVQSDKLNPHMVSVEKLIPSDVGFAGAKNSRAKRSVFKSYAGTELLKQYNGYTIPNPTILELKEQQRLRSAVYSDGPRQSPIRDTSRSFTHQPNNVVLPDRNRTVAFDSTESHKDSSLQKLHTVNSDVLLKLPGSTVAHENHVASTQSREKVITGPEAVKNSRSRCKDVPKVITGSEDVKNSRSGRKDAPGEHSRPSFQRQAIDGRIGPSSRVEAARTAEMMAAAIVSHQGSPDAAQGPTSHRSIASAITASSFSRGQASQAAGGSLLSASQNRNKISIGGRTMELSGRMTLVRGGQVFGEAELSGTARS